jgi:hypothetical protein
VEDKTHSGPFVMEESGILVEVSGSTTTRVKACKNIISYLIIPQLNEKGFGKWIAYRISGLG